MNDADPRVVLHDVTVDGSADIETVVAAISKAVAGATSSQSIREADLVRAIRKSISQRPTEKTPSRSRGIVGGAAGSEVQR